MAAIIGPSTELMWSVMWLLAVCLFVADPAVASFDDSVASLVLKNGYPFEEHQVKTEDGYLLTLHRIPSGKKDPEHIGRPVLLQHGLLCSSASWVLSRPDKGLGYILADQGYDVWMPNSRGNTYSRKHTRLNPDKEPDATKFWNFSFHEMGYYDLPATIDYILQETGHQGLHYVGHSQGTTIFFVLASSRPEYNQKILQMSALGPVAFLDHTRGTVHGLVYVASELEWFTKKTGVHEFLADSWYIHLTEKILCRAYSYTEEICDNIIFLIAGYDSQQLNVSLVPIITSYNPAGASIKQLVHYAQIAKNAGEKFRQFDYGKKMNLKVYNQEEPPDYDLSKVSTPVMLHYSQNDWLSGVPDVVKLNSSLPNSNSRLVPYYKFNHIDFMWAVDVCSLLYNDMVLRTAREEDLVCRLYRNSAVLLSYDVVFHTV